jgi:excinuclease ABC subunit B
MYADTVTKSMDRAIKETARRRKIQNDYNVEHGIVPHTIKKPIRDLIRYGEKVDSNSSGDTFVETDFQKMSKKEQKELLGNLQKQMQNAAKQLNFEEAATLRDTIVELKGEMD